MRRVVLVSLMLAVMLASASLAAASEAAPKAAAAAAKGKATAAATQISAPCTPSCGKHGICSVGQCRCEPGWGGVACKTQLSCPADCSHHGVCHKGVCQCEAYFGGADCSILTLPSWPCPKINGRECGGRGLCHLGKCFCEPSFQGHACGKVVQNSCGKANCGGAERGVCRFGECFCKPGFAGAQCQSEKKCSEACSAHGVCLLGECKCALGFAGPDCTVQLSKAERQAAIEHDVVNSVIAAVGPKAKRAACGTVAKGCGKRGVCHLGRCRCEAGFGGADCSKKSPAATAAACAKDCGANGECLFGQCVCLPGFRGKDCSKPAFVPCPNDCSAHGLCYLGKCECAPGFLGKDCSEVQQCKKGCVRGACVQGMCECVYGFKGEDCSVQMEAAELPPKDYLSAKGLDTCGKNGCGPHGACLSHQCVCVEGYTGSQCDLPLSGFTPRAASESTPANPAVSDIFGTDSCKVNCGSHGVCVGGSCTCVDGWAGVLCTVSVPEIQSHKTYAQENFLSILTKKARVAAEANEARAAAASGASTATATLPVKSALPKKQSKKAVSLLEADSASDADVIPDVVPRAARTTAILAADRSTDSSVAIDAAASAARSMARGGSSVSPSSKTALGVDGPVIKSSPNQVEMNNAAAGNGASYHMSMSPLLMAALCFLTGLLVTMSLKCMLDKRDEEKRKMKKMEELLQPAA